MCTYTNCKNARTVLLSSWQHLAALLLVLLLLVPSSLNPHITVIAQLHLPAADPETDNPSTAQVTSGFVSLYLLHTKMYAYTMGDNHMCGWYNYMHTYMHVELNHYPVWPCKQVVTDELKVAEGIKFYGVTRGAWAKPMCVEAKERLVGMV